MHRFANPARFMRLSSTLLPILGAACVILFAVGLLYALKLSPPDYQQGEMVRMMYVHVPAAWLALGVYTSMALASAIFLIWKHPLASLAASQSAPLGAIFTAICLATGAIWGKPMWGAWWVWDARLTSVLILFFIYVGYMALESSLEPGEKGRKVLAIYALVGFANIPVIKFSVEWWNTLHQPASIIRGEGVAIHDGQMLTALFTMGAAYACLYGWLLLLRLRACLMIQKARRAG